MFIYKITNNINGKIYIGLTTKSLEERWIGHLKSYKSKDFALYRAMRKYGIENFKISELEKCDSLEELIEKESYYIQNLDSMNPKTGYNMMRQNDSIRFITDNVRNKMIESQKLYRANLTPERKKEIYTKAGNTRQGEKRSNKKFVGVFSSSNNTSFSTELTYCYKKYRRSFSTELEAAEAYDKMALYVYGETATINFPNKRQEYLDSDLENYADYFINAKQKQGRKPKSTYNFEDLISESKEKAIEEMRKCVTILTEKDARWLVNPQFLYDGTLKYGE